MLHQVHVEMFLGKVQRPPCRSKWPRNMNLQLAIRLWHTSAWNIPRGYAKQICLTRSLNLPPNLRHPSVRNSCDNESLSLSGSRTSSKRNMNMTTHSRIVVVSSNIWVGTTSSVGTSGGRGRTGFEEPSLDMFERRELRQRCQRL